MRKLWNRPASPVWSLSTRDADGKGNMNICTYVTSISLQPKLMVVAVYHHTKTLKNLKAHPHALLQLLTEDHADIVRTCGRQSGNSINKLVRVGKKHPLETKHDLTYFADSAGYMELEFVEFSEVGGDHLVGIAKVKNATNFSSQSPILTTDYLKTHKIIR
jgi:flavin reductase (DIM6/NTAB) family NADH-FMN oxidoreductase RutF